MYNFSRKGYDSLHAAAAEAVQRIYESGVSFRDGKVSPGHNNVRADSAAKAFSEEEMESLRQSDNTVEQAFFYMIGLRLEYSALEMDHPAGPVLLQEMVNLAEEMKDLGWRPRSEPVRLVHSVPAPKPASVDFNYDRAQLEALRRNWDSLPETCKKLNRDPAP